MDKSLRTYLQWRFYLHCFPRYRQYCNEWIDNVTPDQVLYFKEEMKRLTDNGIYKGL